MNETLAAIFNQTPKLSELICKNMTIILRNIDQPKRLAANILFEPFVEVVNFNSLDFN